MHAARSGPAPSHLQLLSAQVIAFAQVPGAATATRSIVGRGREKIADARRRLFKPSAQQPFPQQHLDPAAASAIAAAQRVGDHATLPPLPRARGRHPMYRLAFTVRLPHNNNSTVAPHLPNKAGAHTFLIWQVPWIGKKFPSWFPYFLIRQVPTPS